MSDPIIVQHLGKRFCRHSSNRPHTIMDAVLSGRRNVKPSEYFWALRDISFSVSAGEMLGVVGKNGAGKSTLLQLIGGVGHPDEGQVIVRGRIGALLDLGAGFHPDLTGRENVFVGGIVAGLTRREVARRFDDIVEFAELQSFIDNPLRTYSTGMQMRLGFSVAIHCDPEVLLVDEFLSVGDVRFQEKCLRHVSQLRRNGCAIIYISHSPQQIEQLCDRALWLKQGQVSAYGRPEIVIGQYSAEMISVSPVRQPLQRTKKNGVGTQLLLNQNRFGSMEAEINDVYLPSGSSILCGDPLEITVEYELFDELISPIVGISISDEAEKIYYDITTQMMGVSLPSRKGKQTINLQINRLDLKGGNYFVDVGLYEKNWAYAYDYHWHAYPLIIQPTWGNTTIISPPSKWKLSPESVLHNKESFEHSSTPTNPIASTTLPESS